MADPKALQRRVNELSQAVQADPASVARRLELAAALRDAGRLGEAVELYRGVALLYAEEGRFAQAIAVCRGILEIDPVHQETSELLAEIAGRRATTRRASERPTPMSSWAAADFSRVGDPAPLPPPPGPRADKTPIPMWLSEDAEPEETVVELRTWRPPPLDEPAEDPHSAVTAPFPKEEITDAGRPVPAAVRRDITSPDFAPPTPEEDALLSGALGMPWPPPDLSVEPPPFPLLGDLPRPALVDLIARLRVRREPPGTWIVREGEPGSACYLIAAGRVRVVKGGREVAQLSAGSFFGEFAVLADQRRHASVEVVEEVELLEISRVLLDALVGQHPGVARTLRRFYRERLLETLLATAPFFEPLSPAERAEIAARFQPRRFVRGAEVIRQGEPGGGLYLVLVGEVEVVRSEREATVRLATLGEGSYFGEMSLLRGGVASATVRALRMTEAVQLGPRDFYEVASAHPVLWDALRTEAARRELLNHAILAGEARRNGDGQIYLV